MRAACTAAVALSLVLSGCSGTDIALDSTHFSEPSRKNDITTGSVSTSSAKSDNSQSQSNPAAQALAEVHELHSKGRKSEAMSRIEKVAGMGPEHSDLQKTRAMLALELGQLSKAEALLRKSLNGDPADWRLHSALGAALSAQGKQLDAQLAFARALEYSPDNPAVLNNLALSYALDAKRKPAEDLLRRVVASKAPKQHMDRARQNLALLLGLNGRLSEAEQVSRRALPDADTTQNMRILSQSKPKPSELKSADTGSVGLTPPVYRLGGPDQP